MNHRYNTKPVQGTYLKTDSARKRFYRTNDRFRNCFCKWVLLLEAWRITEFISTFLLSFWFHCMKSVRIRSYFGRIFCIRTEYRKILSISPYTVQMRENTDQNNSEYGHFLCCECMLGLWTCFVLFRKVRISLNLAAILVIIFWNFKDF